MRKYIYHRTICAQQKRQLRRCSVSEAAMLNVACLTYSVRVGSVQPKQRLKQLRHLLLEPAGRALAWQERRVGMSVTIPQVEGAAATRKLPKLDKLDGTRPHNRPSGLAACFPPSSLALGGSV